MVERGLTRGAAARQCIAALSLALLVTLGVGGCSERLDEEQRMARAAEHYELGRFRGAMIDLRNTLETNPSNVTARRMLGEVALALGDPATAEKELRRAYELGAPKNELLTSIGLAYLEMGQLERVLTELDPLKAPDNATAAQWLALRGNAHLTGGNVDEARASFEAAVARDPDSLLTRLGMAQLLRQVNDTAGTEAHLAHALDTHPNDVRARLAMARFLLENKHLGEAERSFQAALELPAAQHLSRNRLDALVGLSEAQLGLGKREAAAATIDEFVRLTPRHPIGDFLRARLAFDNKEYPVAEDHLTKVLAAAPEYDPARMLQGAVNLLTGDYAQAEMYLKAVVLNNPENVQARKMLAASRMGLEQPETAVDALLPAGGKGFDGDLLALIGQASVQAGDYAAGLEFFERGAREDPDNIQLQLELAAGYIITGDIPKAIALLEGLEAEGGEAERSRVLLTLAHVRTGDFAAARSTIAVMSADMPESSTIRGLQAAVEMSAGDYVEARRHFEHAIELDPTNTSAVVNLARLDLRESGEQAAYARIVALLKVSPEDVIGLTALAQLDERRGDKAQALENLQRARALDPAAVQPRLLLARILLVDGDYDQTIALGDEIIAARPAGAVGYDVRGQAQMANGQLAAALGSFRRAVSLEPRTVGPLFNMARAMLALGRPVQARETAERVLTISPEHLGANAMMGGLQLTRGKVRAAERIADLLSELYPDEALTRALKGDIYMENEQYEQAVAAFTSAFAAEKNARFLARLYQARRASGDRNADKLLTDWLEGHPRDLGVRLLVAQHAQSVGEIDEAIEHYKHVVEAQPQNAVALNNLAWLYSGRNDELALETADRAYKAAPSNGAIADTYGWLLVQQGDLAKGVPILREAVSNAPDIADIRYHLAVALAQGGDKEESRAILTQLLDADVAFADRSEAKRLLAEL